MRTYLAIVIAGLLLLAGCAQDAGEQTMSNPQVILETTEGNIEIELYSEQAPTTVQNFLDYVNAGHYDGLVFHRVIPGFMIQGGGFDAEGQQRRVQAPISLETHAGLKNTRGTLAMARTNDPNSATSQFFINTVDNAFLNPGQGPGYAVFGQVTQGMDVIDKIAQLPTANRGPHQDWPVEDVVITKATVK